MDGDIFYLCRDYLKKQRRHQMLLKLQIVLDYMKNWKTFKEGLCCTFIYTCTCTCTVCSGTCTCILCMNSL